jgi:NAD(P)-dependent dehydrogenase (short-subunit alcohol dehydrogenase family)
VTGLLAGQRALVTGASRGIGRGIASALAEQGCMVAVAARTAEVLAETVALARVRGGIMAAVTADLSDAAACSGLVGRSAEALGGSIDILVHNAGAPSSAKVVDATLADWEHLMMLHATAAFLLAKSAAPCNDRESVATHSERRIGIFASRRRRSASTGGCTKDERAQLLGLPCPCLGTTRSGRGGSATHDWLSRMPASSEATAHFR